MTRRNCRAELQEWFADVDRLLAEEREHAISPSTVPLPNTEPAVWKMRLTLALGPRWSTSIEIPVSTG